MFGYTFRRNEEKTEKRPPQIGVPTLASDVTEVYNFVNSNRGNTQNLDIARQNGIQRGHIGVAYHASDAAQKPLTEEELFRTFRNHLYRTTSLFEATKRTVEGGASSQDEAKQAAEEFEYQLPTDRLLSVSLGSLFLKRIDRSVVVGMEQTETPLEIMV